MRIDAVLPELERTLGEIRYLNEECTDVYYLSAQKQSEEKRAPVQEYYAVFRDADMISDKAKSLGQTVMGIADVLIYPKEPPESGWLIVDYEVKRHLHRADPKPETADALREAAAFGRETHPDYFGCFPIPFQTPFGCFLRSIELDQGICWIETDQPAYTLCLCYPIWDDLSDYAKSYSAEAAQIKVSEMDNHQGCLFFSERAASLPFFELMQWRPQWQTNGIIDSIALMNAVWRDFPEYAVSHNAAVQRGAGDGLGLLLNAAGFHVELAVDKTQWIQMNPDTGTDYLHIAL